jgi:hypothetical protein
MSRLARRLVHQQDLRLWRMARAGATPSVVSRRKLPQRPIREMGSRIASITASPFPVLPAGERNTRSVRQPGHQPPRRQDRNAGRPGTTAGVADAGDASRSPSPSLPAPEEISAPSNRLEAGMTFRSVVFPAPLARRFPTKLVAAKAEENPVQRSEPPFRPSRRRIRRVHSEPPPHRFHVLLERGEYPLSEGNSKGPRAAPPASAIPSRVGARLQVSRPGRRAPPCAALERRSTSWPTSSPAFRTPADARPQPLQRSLCRRRARTEAPDPRLRIGRQARPPSPPLRGRARLPGRDRAGVVGESRRELPPGGRAPEGNSGTN